MIAMIVYYDDYGEIEEMTEFCEESGEYGVSDHNLDD